MWVADLTYLNMTRDKCITSVVVELTLSYGGRVSTERREVALGSPLSPGKDGDVFVDIAAPKRGKSVSLVKWHSVSLSGFGAADNPYAEFGGHRVQ